MPTTSGRLSEMDSKYHIRTEYRDSDQELRTVTARWSNINSDQKSQNDIFGRRASSGNTKRQDSGLDRLPAVRFNMLAGGVEQVGALQLTKIPDHYADFVFKDEGTLKQCAAKTPQQQGIIREAFELLSLWKRSSSAIG